MGVIFYFSSLPHLKSPFAWDLVLRKVAHALEYAVLAILCSRALKGSEVQPPVHLYSAFAIAVLYAVSDEFHQSFVPGREATPLDIGIDSIGSAIGIYLHARALLPRWLLD